ncbi:hypothetical protein FRC12_010947 [Ceratobasidium sp. 428]|nr:hypothetical protein FRC12_010947 [Ceratobasidium sp. 428]
MVSASRLSPEHIAKMEDSEATNILPHPPALVLKSAHSEEEQHLKNQYFSRHRGNEWLSDEELYEIKERLDMLRNKKVRCMLWDNTFKIAS